MSQTIDPLLIEIADYVNDSTFSDKTLECASDCLMDALGCAIRALDSDTCHRHLGPIVPGMELDGGARVPGTGYQLDPVQAAYNIGCMIRWLDFNDCWLAAEWGHPSDNLGAILACADFVDRQTNRKKHMRMRQILDALTKAYEIQGGVITQ